VKVGQLESRLGYGSPAGGLPRFKPLSSAEQRALFRKLRRPGTSAREREQLRSLLVVGTFRVVLHCLRSVAGRQRVAELVQEGVLALADAVDVFATCNRTDFVRFAVTRVARWLGGIQRRWKRERSILVETPVELLGDEQTSDPFSAASQLELEERLQEMIGCLPDAQQRVLRLRFGIGVREAQSREAISRELSMERQRVRYLEERALLTLRRRVERHPSLDWTSK
jgi:RNA polymerase sigma factor (sigma-70 family)